MNERFLTKIVTKLLVYLGTPPNVAVRLSPILTKVLVAFFSLSIVITFSLFVVNIDDDDSIPSTPAYEVLDSEVRTTIETVSVEYDIPPRLLAALAMAQTLGGTISPYDTVTRGSDVQSSVFPVTVPSIGNTTNRTEGLGPYLIKQRVVKREKINPQNWREATVFLANIIANERDNLYRAGVKEPLTAEEFDMFWGKVISTLPVVDPITGGSGCAADPSDIGNAIITIFDCKVREYGVRLPHVSLVNNVHVLKLLSESESAGLVVQDALSVAWIWGKHNGAGNWSDINASCSNKSTLAGVFPLSTAQAKEYKLDDRCDVVSNIVTAADIYVKSLSTEPVIGDRPYEVMQEGWLDLNRNILGDNNSINSFANRGPWREYTPGNSCYDASNLWVTRLLSESELNPIIAENSAELLTYLKNDKSYIPLNDPRCIDISTSERPTLEMYLTYLKPIVISLRSELEEGAIAIRGASSPVLDNLLLIIDNNQKSFSPTSAKWAETSAIKRLSSKHVTVNYPFVQRNIAGGYSGLAARVIGYAIEFGGLIGNDDRFGSNPYASLSATGFGSVGGIGVTIEREDPNAKDVITSQTLLTQLRCGADSVPRFALSVTALRWEAMCEAAARDGVNLSVVSAWRSMAQQQALYQSYKGSNARVAKPGSSPHQKGQSVDVYLGSSDGVLLNDRNEYAWLHSIVGCYSDDSKKYVLLPAPLLNENYIASDKTGNPPCGRDSLPIKRMQTYGFVPLCTLEPISRFESLASHGALLCASNTVIPGSASNQIREPWHLDIGILLSVSQSASSTSISCVIPNNLDIFEKQDVAIAIHDFWFCRLSELGFNRQPVKGPTWYTKNLFMNYAEQIASEAVYISFCQSKLNPSYRDDDSFGLFALKTSDFKNLGRDPRLWAEADYNIAAAFEVWIDNKKKPSIFEGWLTWDSVNTSLYDAKKMAFSTPVLGRFNAVPPSPNVGSNYNEPLPRWSIDPKNSWSSNISCG